MSNKANSANEKSFLLLEQMLKSLFNVANKVSTVSQNENELAKVENMVNQAGNIQKATQMMDEIA
ncbi:histidine kinase, partial [Campylobacter jejuni]|nr:histidine kinase [Campylobacter jejuni]